VNGPGVDEVWGALQGKVPAVIGISIVPIAGSNNYRVITRVFGKEAGNPLSNSGAAGNTECTAFTKVHLNVNNE
jgi:hypothetical protein